MTDEFTADAINLISFEEVKQNYGLDEYAIVYYIDNWQLTAFERISHGPLPFNPSIYSDTPEIYDALERKFKRDFQVTYREVRKDSVGSSSPEIAKSFYFMRSNIEALLKGKPDVRASHKAVSNKKSDITQAAYEKLATALNFELENTPDLPPDRSPELVDMMFRAKAVQDIITKNIGSKATANHFEYLRRRLRKLELLNKRLILKGGRPSKTV
jgi:hypothetical protein